MDKVNAWMDKVASDAIGDGLGEANRFRGENFKYHVADRSAAVTQRVALIPLEASAAKSLS
jgi:hypothetical protein